MNIFYIRSGINQNAAATYSIKKLYSNKDEQANEQADEQASEHIIITKLNLLFIYIYNNGSGEKIGIFEKDRTALILQLKRLELFSENQKAFEFMSESALMDQKIMMWVVKELYQSPYKIYLNTIKKETFKLKYLKTKKYIMSKKLYSINEIINYFMACLYEEFEK